MLHNRGCDCSLRKDPRKVDGQHRCRDQPELGGTQDPGQHRHAADGHQSLQAVSGPHPHPARESVPGAVDRRLLVAGGCHEGLARTNGPRAVCSPTRDPTEATQPAVKGTVWGRRRGNSTCRSERVRRRSEEHTSELQSLTNLVCRLLLEKKKEASTI